MDLPFLFIDMVLHFDKYLPGIIESYGFWTYLILAGALSIIGLYAAAVLAAAVLIFVLMELCGAVITGNSGQVVMILSGILLFLALYSGTGLWLQKTGRI